MSVQVEKLENNQAKLTFSVTAEEFDKAVNRVFERRKKSISIPGFRKGKAPRKFIEKMYGAMFFYEEAVNDVVYPAYVTAADESKLDIVSQPQIGLEQLEPGKDVVFTAVVDLKPEVELGVYRGVEIPAADRKEVTEEDIDAEVKKEQEKNGRLVTVEDRPAEMGDTVNFDYEGSVNGVPFEGGAAKGYDLELGSHQFIPGFEEGLVGVSAGEHRDVTVTFPEKYHSEELAGKEAVFACDIHKIQKMELPELDDEFVQDVSSFDTMEEYRADIRKNLETARAEGLKNAKRSAAASKAVENAKLTIPAGMVAMEAEDMFEQQSRNFEHQGFSMDQYMKLTGMSREAMIDQMRPQAEIQIRNRLVLEKIAEVEGIEISDEELEKEYGIVAEEYSMPLEDVKKTFANNTKMLTDDMKIRKAVDLIAEYAVEKPVEAAEDAPEADKTEE